jgi:hypothetical protein
MTDINYVVVMEPHDFKIKKSEMELLIKDFLKSLPCHCSVESPKEDFQSLKVDPSSGCFIFHQEFSEMKTIRF